MDKIIAYLVDSLEQSERAAKRNATKLSKYADIKEEFEQWIETQTYPDEGIVIEGYNAKKISELATFMNGVGVYNFLVTLRDNTEFALQSIREGFPRRIID